MRHFHIFLFLIGMLSISGANAGVIIGGSRLIYEGNKKEKAIGIENPDTSPYLIQSWVEDEQGNTIKDTPPFIVTPPLFRMDGGQKNLLRIIRGARALPQDKESLYWLNIKSIPSSSEENRNTLQIAVRSRLKLIYRPDALSGETAEKHTDELVWKTEGTTLTVTNPSDYYMNFMFIKINNNSITEGGLVAPRSSATFKLPASNVAGSISWKLINDYGGIGELHHASL
ncbi:molecular chaperone [Erwinia sp. BC051422]|uniref:fimbrial biogenesis chaperone n=1 Tax=Erwinia wuhanensis TaxID=3045167 RepID=UPI00264AB4B6|nr:molecular chaperone [Erwinia sp. BC051422]MDN8542200.1 molecular chaperone [Erwinia sp. BC051422]